MTTSVIPFGQENLDDAAQLLARRHSRDRLNAAHLPVQFEDPTTARELVAGQLSRPGSYGAAAFDGKRMIGFLIGSEVLPEPRNFLIRFFAPRTLSINIASHALDPEADATTYFRLYEPAARTAVSRGFYTHAINLPAHDLAARDAWFALAFGQTSYGAMRDVAEPVGKPAPVDIRNATTEDLPVIHALHEHLIQHHAVSPIFTPDLPETRESSTWEADLLQNPNTPYFVATRNGKVLGMQSLVAPPSMFSPLSTPERCVYVLQAVVHKSAREQGVGAALLARGMDWAREHDFVWCGVHFASSNLPGSRFWLGNGFRPFEINLTRHIDERIAWAGERETLWGGNIPSVSGED